MTSTESADPFLKRRSALILTALLVRAGYGVLFVTRPGAPAPVAASTWGRITGDSSSYLEPIENLILSGTYAPDYRMPGYGAVYLVLRMALNHAGALNALIVLQIFASAISVYALARIANACFGGRAAWMVFFAYLASTYTAIFDVYFASESFATSALILGLALFVRACLLENGLRHFAAAGALMAWCVFLRPVLIGPLLLLGIAILVKGVTPRKDRWHRTAAATAFFIPFLVIDGCWLVRNYLSHGVLQPLAPRYAPYGDLELSLFRFMQSWGGSLVHWNPKAEIVWFEHMRSPGYTVPENAVRAIRFPAEIYTSRFSYQSLVALKERLRLLKDPDVPENEKRELRAVAAEELDDYTASIRREKPFVYHVRAPLRLMARLLVHSGTYNLLGKSVSALSAWELLFKGVMSALYWWVLILGSIGAFLVLREERLSLGPGTLLVVVVVYIVGAHGFVVRLDEYRYFVPAYPFALCLAAHASLAVLGRTAKYFRTSQ